MKPCPARSTRSTRLARAATLAALLALLPVLPAGAQEEAAEPAQPGRKAVQEIYEVRHADPLALTEVLRVFPIHVQAHAEMGLITLRGNSEDVATAVAAARRLDLPPQPTRSVEVTAHILGASKRSELSGGLPSELEEVGRQLRQVFGYRGVELVDSLSVRVRDRGEALVTGAFFQGEDLEPAPYRLGINRASVVNGQDARSVRLDGLRFMAELPRWRASTSQGEPARRVSSSVNLTTDVEVREGQKAVVGKAATDGDRDSLILVIEARVLE